MSNGLTLDPLDSNPILLDINRANLRGANLNDVYLCGADMRGADMRGAKGCFSQGNC